MAALLEPGDVEFLDLIDEVFLENEENDIARDPRRYVREFNNPLEWYNDVQFKRRYRFTKDVVRHHILPLLFFEEPRNRRGLPLPPILQLLIALRFYATGSFQLVAGNLTGVSDSTVCRIIKRISVGLAQRTRQLIRFPTGADFRSNKLKFYNIAHFPGVTGVIDCTHIEIKSPGGARGEVYRNRKGYFSLNVQVVAGASMEIFDIVCRWPGSAHDSRIFNNSGVKTRFEDGRVQGLLLGDSGYPQLPYLFTPIPEEAVHTNAEQRYNMAHVRTRNLVERMFGVWKQRFPCLQLVLRNKLQTTAAIIVACAILHNIGIRHNDYVEEAELQANDDVPILPVPLRPGRAMAMRNDFIIRHFN